MYLACQEGHLSVCKWLYQAGAAADITKATRWDAGWTPMLYRKKAPLPCSSPRTGAPARRGVVKERVSAARALRALASTSPVPGVAGVAVAGVAVASSRRTKRTRPGNRSHVVGLV